MNHHLISRELINAVIQQVISTFPWVGDSLRTELQDDFQFLLVTVQCDTAPRHTAEERLQLGHLVDDMMPTRDGDLTWMLNFTVEGQIVDSYFGGDANSPALGL